MSNFWKVVCGVLIAAFFILAVPDFTALMLLIIFAVIGIMLALFGSAMTANQANWTGQPIFHLYGIILLGITWFLAFYTFIGQLAIKALNLGH